jgi:hypothetical protein
MMYPFRDILQECTKIDGRIVHDDVLNCERGTKLVLELAFWCVSFELTDVEAGTGTWENLNE